VRVDSTVICVCDVVCGYGNPEARLEGETPVLYGTRYKYSTVPGVLRVPYSTLVAVCSTVPNYRTQDRRRTVGLDCDESCVQRYTVLYCVCEEGALWKRKSRRSPSLDFRLILFCRRTKTQQVLSA
jgi:hypothetical protein